jgi:hypothetical protein
VSSTSPRGVKRTLRRAHPDIRKMLLTAHEQNFKIKVTANNHFLVGAPCHGCDRGGWATIPCTPGDDMHGAANARAQLRRIGVRFNRKEKELMSTAHTVMYTEQAAAKRDALPPERHVTFDKGIEILCQDPYTNVSHPIGGDWREVRLTPKILVEYSAHAGQLVIYDVRIFDDFDVIIDE